jgi:carbamoyltransferase
MIVVGYNGFTRGAELFGRAFGSTGIDRHRILGHDAAVAVMVDGELVAAAEEERFNREKKTSGFPASALNWALSVAGVGPDEVDVFAFPWFFSPAVIDTMVQDICATAPVVEEKFERLHRFGQLYDALLGRRAIRADFAERTGYDLPEDKFVLVPHHFAHLMCGHYLSGGENAAFMVSDGRGEHLSAIIGEVQDGHIHVLESSSVGAADSLGLLFGELTRYLGFMPNNDEYKVMGLAGFAPPEPGNPLLEQAVKLAPEGCYTLAVPWPGQGATTPAYYELFDRIFDADASVREELGFRIRVASWAQEMVEVVTAHHLRVLEAASDLPRLIFEGGLALNCVNNTRLLESSRFSDIDVSFGASDPGVSIGAAAYVSAQAGFPPPPERASAYLGPEYGSAAIRSALESYADRVTWTELEPEAVAGETAKLLCEKVVVGWFQGRTEYGPRALGHRSILANPGFADIKDIINTRVKHREPFRPFAPIVLESEAPRVFDMGKKRSSPFMTFVFPVRPQYLQVIPGAVHVDGTSRIQTVTEQENPELAELLRIFTDLTGVPCLINTSFNVAGEPIVNSPGDALECFLHTEIDHLVLGRFMVHKRG